MYYIAPMCYSSDWLVSGRRASARTAGCAHPRKRVDTQRRGSVSGASTVAGNVRSSGSCSSRALDLERHAATPGAAVPGTRGSSLLGFGQPHQPCCGRRVPRGHRDGERGLHRRDDLVSGVVAHPVSDLTDGVGSPRAGRRDRRGADVRQPDLPLKRRASCLPRPAVLGQLPEFSRAALEALRLPLQDGEVVNSRAAGRGRRPPGADLKPGLRRTRACCSQNHLLIRHQQLPPLRQP